MRAQEEVSIALAVQAANHAKQLCRSSGSRSRRAMSCM